MKQVIEPLLSHTFNPPSLKSHNLMNARPYGVVAVNHVQRHKWARCRHRWNAIASGQPCVAGGRQATQPAPPPLRTDSASSAHVQHS